MDIAANWVLLFTRPYSRIVDIVQIVSASYRHINIEWILLSDERDSGKLIIVVVI